tara:strand:- start:243 stop:2156 length:1914 start_codon:yes stop_codon:yes gene_type:complete
MRGRINPFKVAVDPHPAENELDAFNSNLVELGGSFVFSEHGDFYPPINIEKIAVESNSVSIKFLADIPQEENMFMRIVASTDEKFSDETTEDELRAAPNIFFPTEVAIYDRSIRHGATTAKIIDLNPRQGENLIRFDNFATHEHLCIFLVFFSEGLYTIFKLNVVYREQLLVPTLTFDHRYKEAEKQVNIALPTKENVEFLVGKQEQHKFSKFYYCYDTRQNLRYVFSFDLQNFLMDRVAFPEMLTESNYLASVKHVEITRAREKFPDTDIVETKIIPVSSFKLQVENGDGLVYYGGIDETARKGHYRYSVHMIIIDPTISHAEAHVEQVSSVLPDLSLLPREQELDISAIQKHQERLAASSAADRDPDKFSFLDTHVASNASLSREQCNKTVELIQGSIAGIHSRVRSYKARTTLMPLTGSSGAYQSRFEDNGARISSRAMNVHFTFPTINTTVERVVVNNESNEQLSDMPFAINFADQFVGDGLTISMKSSKASGIKKINLGLGIEGRTLPGRQFRYDPIQIIKTVDAFDESEDKYDDYTSKKLSIGAAKLYKDLEFFGIKKMSTKEIVVAESEKNYEIEYLANYNVGSLKAKKSIRIEKWITLKSASEIPNATVLARFKSAEDIINKYFFIVQG